MNLPALYLEIEKYLEKGMLDLKLTQSFRLLWSAWMW
jgi:hypothetical protein